MKSIKQPCVCKTQITQFCFHHKNNCFTKKQQKVLTFDIIFLGVRRRDRRIGHPQRGQLQRFDVDNATAA